MLESVYEIILASVLERNGFHVERQLPISFSHDGIEFVHAFRADLVVEGRVIVEVKSIERIAAVHPKQLLTYLRLTDLRRPPSELRCRDHEGRHQASRE